MKVYIKIVINSGCTQAILIILESKFSCSSATEQCKRNISSIFRAEDTYGLTNGFQ